MIHSRADHLRQLICHLPVQLLGHRARGDGDSQALRTRFPQLVHPLLLLFQVVLLRPDDASWPADSNPGDGLPGSEEIVLHEVECDERASASETSLAMNGNNSARGVFRNRQELVRDLVRGSCAVHEEEVVVSDACFDEGSLVVLFGIEANHGLHSLGLEHFQVCSRMNRKILLLTVIPRAFEGNKLAPQNLVKVAILRVVIVEVFSDIKVIHVEEVLSNCMDKCFPTILNVQIEGALHPCGISVVQIPPTFDLMKALPSLICRGIQIETEECTKQEDRVREIFHLRVVHKNDIALFVGLILE
mmetsp:Transcript_16481/g.37626  ORF Transcript_16481/g.37626 Transcript_16481/m.37626 type:complete len:303 (+) Transcript_16481:305-1213(+)